MYLNSYYTFSIKKYISIIWEYPWKRHTHYSDLWSYKMSSHNVTGHLHMKHFCNNIRYITLAD